MKAWKLFWYFVLGATLAAGAMPACGKKDDNGNAVSNGSLVSDGLNVSSQSSTVQGVSLNMSVRNIMAYSATQNMWAMPTTTYGTGSPAQISFEVIVNGQSQYLQTNQVPSSLSSWSSWQKVSNFWVAHSGACVDAQCSQAVLALIFTPVLQNGQQNYEVRHVSIKKDMRSNRVISLRERSYPFSSTGSFPSAQVMVNQF